jgi:hypothetical protein
MTLESRITAQVQAWKDAGQIEHAEWLRREMWRILGPFVRPRAHLSGAK